MGQINILSRQLVNKIAAGEVIERPASVVKELLENAIDAGATRIDVTVEDGGKRLIQVSDNGSGMDGEDIGLAFRAHATSKLTKSEDLFAIETMGFRGEALASIASISRARIVSRTADGQGGHEINCQAGQLEQAKPTAGAVGTTISIRDLFFNVPVRRRFLKSTTTEISHISEQLTRAALAYPQIHFTLRHNDRKSLDLPASDNVPERVAGLFGDELAQTLIEANSNERSIEIRALLGPPDMSRASGKWQYIFLNSRYIRDRFVQHALREAYRGLTDAKRFPVAFIYLQMHPEMFDVNVHPTKIEVRFRDSNAVHSQVLGTLRECLLKSDLSGRVQLDGVERDKGTDQSVEHVRQAMADFLKSRPTQQHLPAFRPKNTGHSAATSGRGPSTAQLRDELDRLFESDRQGQQGPAVQPESTDHGPNLAPLGEVLQIHRTYLVAQTAEGLVIVDQHALHERILYEKLQRRIQAGLVTSQQLLIPMPLELSDQQRELLEQHRELLGRLGIELVAHDGHGLAVQSFPAMLDKADPAAVVQDIVDRLGEMAGDSAAEQILEQVLASMSCKAAVKAGDKLSEQEMLQLLAEKELAERSSSCPHGRPTTLKLSLAELEKQFGRT